MKELGKKFFEIESIKELNDMIQSSENLLIDAYTTWCGPCKQLSKIIEENIDELNSEFPNLSIAKINVGDDGNVANTEFVHQIKNIPVLFLFSNKNLLSKHVGMLDKANLFKWIHQVEKNLADLN